MNALENGDAHKMIAKIVFTTAVSQTQLICMAHKIEQYR